jgi:taurine dioxygenase
MSPEFHPLTKAIGAEVRGIDLSRPQSPEVMAAIARAWDEYGVLLFRDQDLSGESQRAFTAAFGTVHVLASSAQKGSEFMHIGNVEVNGVPGQLALGEMQFHQDGCYNEQPLRRTFLYSLKIPSAGGNTLFASTAHAYARLPNDLRERILNYDIRFAYNYTALVRDATTKPTSEYVHPLVIAHPGTGNPLLYCNRLMAEEIVGLPPDESRALIERLCSELERPEGIYEHVWRLGDFLMWDNFATAHARTDFDPAEERLLRRTTTSGEPVTAFRERLAAR